MAHFAKLTSCISFLAGMGFVAILAAQPVSAQSAQDAADPASQFDIQDGDTGIFSGGSGSSGIFDLIHRTRLGGGSFDAAEQQENLNDAATSFRELQKQRLDKEAGPESTPAE